MKSFLITIFLFGIFAHCQDPSRFADEVSALQKTYDTLWDSSKETIVFTGSSSVRIWNDLQERFPNHQIVNSGFGGSQASDLLAIIAQIRAQNATTEIILIGAKPSIARWNLKKNYKRLNRKFRKLSRRDVDMNYADVWKPMLHRRKVKEDIFIEDGLHMNAKGYEIWYRALKPYVK